jgi:hypothetical protein
MIPPEVLELGCILAVLALASPRLVLLLVAVFNWDYLFRVYHTALLPLLGFVFLPLTTLVYAVAANSFGGVHSWGLVFVVLALFIDLGSLTGGGALGRRRLV